MDTTQQDPRRGWRRFCTMRNGARLSALLLGLAIFLAFNVLVPPLPRLELHADKPLCLECFSPDGNMVVTTTYALPEDETTHHRWPIQVWDVSSGQRQLTLTEGTLTNDTLTEDGPEVRHVNFSTDGERLIARVWYGNTFGIIKRWDVMTGEEDVTTKFNDERAELEENKTGRWRLVAEPNGVKVLDAATQREHGRLQQAGDFRHALGSVSVLTAPDNQTVAVWGTSTKHEPSLLATIQARLQGSAPLLGNDVHITRLWNAETCEELAPFERCHRAAFSPDGKTLATEHCDGTVRLWDLPIRKPLLADFGFTLALWSALMLGIRLLGWWVRRPTPALSPP